MDAYIYRKVYVVEEDMELSCQADMKSLVMESLAKIILNWENVRKYSWTQNVSNVSNFQELSSLKYNFKNWIIL